MKVRRLSFYGTYIARALARARIGDVDPRHVEGWMRVEHGTLDALCPERFAREVAIAVECIRSAGVEESERLARSYGLVP